MLFLQQLVEMCFKMSITSLPTQNNLNTGLRISIYFRNLMTGFIASGAVGGNGMVHTYTNNNNENVHFVHTFSINILKTETNRYFVFQVKNSVI